MNHHRRHFMLLANWSVALCLSVVAMSSVSWGQQQPLRSTWDCLPEETVLAVRIPSGTAIAKALIENTKLGAVLFSERRIDKAKSWLFEQEDDEGDSIRGRLKQYGLAPDDLAALCAEETGLAIVVDHPADASPLTLAVVWLDPGVDIAERVFEAIGKAVDERDDDEHPHERFDLEIDTTTVMQVAIPDISIEHDGEFELPDNYDELSEAEAQRAWDRANAAWEASAVEVVRFRTMLVATLGGRLLCAFTLEAADEDKREAAAEQLTDVFARLLAAHRDDEGRFVANLSGIPAFHQIADLDGVVALEVLGDARPIIDVMRTEAAAQHDTETAKKVLDMAGVECLGAFGMRMTLDRSQLRTRVAWALQRPLSGLLRMLDQSQLDPEPPAWVPANVVSYSQYSLDLGKAYGIIKEQVQKHYPNETAAYFQMLEGQVTNMAGANVVEVLGSLGHRHAVLSFEPRFRVVQQSDAREEDDEGASQQPVERTAIVWQIANDEIWPRIMKQIATFAAMAPGLEHADEQGFSGWRYANEALEGGLVLGNGYLVLAYGPGVLEMALSAINRPPQGDAALRDCDIYDRAMELVEPNPSITYELVDGNRYAKVAFKTLANMMEHAERQMASADADEQGTNWTEVARELMLTEDEVDDLIGVTTNQWGVNEYGLWGNSASDLPSAD